MVSNDDHGREVRGGLYHASSPLFSMMMKHQVSVSIRCGREREREIEERASGDTTVVTLQCSPTTTRSSFKLLLLGGRVKARDEPLESSIKEGVGNTILISHLPHTQFGDSSTIHAPTVGDTKGYDLHFIQIFSYRH